MYIHICIDVCYFPFAYVLPELDAEVNPLFIYIYIYI